MTDYNYIAEACTEILRGKNVGYSINGYVTTEEEWKSAYIEQVGNCLLYTSPSPRD